MPEEKRKSEKPSRKDAAGPCETCLYFDVLDESGAEGCVVNVDEDEAYRERAGSAKDCPYYRFYDEYKLVRKQN